MLQEWIDCKATDELNHITEVTLADLIAVCDYIGNGYNRFDSVHISAVHAALSTYYPDAKIYIGCESGSDVFRLTLPVKYQALVGMEIEATKTFGFFWACIRHAADELILSYDAEGYTVVKLWWD